MILTNELKGKMVAKNLRQEDVAIMLGISTKTLNYKLNNKGVFDANEIEKLIEILKIENPIEIFFCKASSLVSEKKKGA